MKVPVPQPEPSLVPDNEQLPPIDDTELPPIDNKQPEGDNDFPFGDEKFDAGVEADEDADPKKYIEQLTGKLAQKLRDYNQTGDDIELNKFVINSLIPASVPEMSEEDANDVVKKVKDNIGTEPAGGEEIPVEGIEIPGEPINNEQPQEELTQESVEEPNVDDLVNEILGRKKLSRNISNKNPFKSPNFK